jgi:hypothetical protein
MMDNEMEIVSKETSQPNQSNILALAWRDWGKSRTISVRVPDIPVRIPTDQLESCLCRMLCNIVCAYVFLVALPFRLPY